MKPDEPQTTNTLTIQFEPQRLPADIGSFSRAVFRACGVRLAATCNIRPKEIFLCGPNNLAAPDKGLRIVDYAVGYKCLGFARHLLK